MKIKNFTSITMFVRAAEHDSFAAAARSLGVTASAVGKSIQRLEEKLQVRLFNRTTRKISLTQEGELFLQKCASLKTALEQAEWAIEDSRQSLKGTIHITLPIAYGKRKIVPKLADFLKEYEDVAIEFTLTDRKVDMIKQGVDIAIRIGEIEDSELICKRVAYQSLILVAAPSLISGRSPNSIDDLETYPLLGYRFPFSGRLHRWRFKTNGKTHVVEPRHSLSFNNNEALLIATLNGLGISLLPDYLVKEEIEEGRLVQLLAKTETETAPISLLYLNKEHMSAKQRVVIDFLTSLAQSE